MERDVKSVRILSIYDSLMRGETVGKAETAEKFSVVGRSIQRDVETIREFLAARGGSMDVGYDRNAGGYRLISSGDNGCADVENFAAVVAGVCCGMRDAQRRGCSVEIEYRRPRDGGSVQRVIEPRDIVVHNGRLWIGANVIDAEEQKIKYFRADRIVRFKLLG